MRTLLILMAAAVVLAGCGPKFAAQGDLIMRDYESAITKYEKYLENNPDDVTARRDLGLAYLKTGRYGKVVELLDPIAGENWDEWRMDWYLAAAQFALGEREEGFRTLDEMIVPPNYSLKQALLAGAERIMRKYEEPDVIVRVMEQLKRRAIQVYLHNDDKGSDNPGGAKWLLYIKKRQQILEDYPPGEDPPMRVVDAGDLSG
jgi:tetratricopeptide (TPR) repeat protein